MFDRSTSVHADNFSFKPICKTTPGSFFVFAIKERTLSSVCWTQELQLEINEENRKERERKNAVSLNNLLGDNPNIEGRSVEILQLLLLNQYATEAIVEVRYK